jgi:polyisoprenoid-binding protein YceI
MRDRSWLKWLIAGGLAVVVLGVGGFLLYWNVIREDGEDPFELTDVTSGTGATTTTAAEASADAALDGTWSVASDSEAGYRAEEILFGQSGSATGRTSQVTGSLDITGTTVEAGVVTVDLASVASGESLRDSQFQGRIMDVATYPTAEFELTEPIELESVPEVGTPVAAAATGELTVKDVTKSVTFDVNAQLLPDGRIEVQGSIPVVWAEYNIGAPSGGPAQVADDGAIEFLLRFAR